jgi:hypothetical protein
MARSDGGMVCELTNVRWYIYNKLYLRESFTPHPSQLRCCTSRLLVHLRLWFITAGHLDGSHHSGTIVEYSRSIFAVRVRCLSMRLATVVFEASYYCV